MDVSDASYYIHNEKEIREPNVAHQKKKFKKDMIGFFTFFA
jgi:hypothetical protein